MQNTSRDEVEIAHLKYSDLYWDDCTDLVLCGCIVFFAECHDVDTLQTILLISKRFSMSGWLTEKQQTIVPWHQVQDQQEVLDSLCLLEVLA